MKVDKLGNWLSGGNIEHTISARVGKYSNEDDYNPGWKLLEAIINFAFYPIDGPEHCFQALNKEITKDPSDDFKEGSKFMKVILSVIVVIFCIPISCTLYLYKKIKRIRF